MTKTEYLLVCLMEECAEIQQAASKILRFGIKENFCSETGLTYDNVDLLSKEVVDFEAVRIMLHDEEVLPSIREAGGDIYLKTQKVKKYMNEHFKENKL